MTDRQTYVLHREDRYQDCTERVTLLITGIEAVNRKLLEWSKIDDPSCMVNMRVFKLGEEVQLDKTTVEEPQPPKVTETFQVRTDDEPRTAD